MTFPEHWSATGCPGYFASISPDAAEHVSVSVMDFAGTLDEYVATSGTVFSDPTSGFVLGEPQRTTLRNGVPAVRVGLGRSDGGPVSGSLLHAVADGHAYLLTYLGIGASSTSTPSRDAIERSFVPGEGEAIIPAECADCTQDELARREAAIAAIASRLAIVNAAHCQDSSAAREERARNALALVYCALPGGFRVDFALWSTGEDLETFGKTFEAEEGTVVKTWTLTEGGPTIGTTVEWVDANGEARFYWTYDEYLISANAALAGGDQERLNNWWQTCAALLRE